MKKIYMTLLLTIAGCGVSDSNIYVLYRNSSMEHDVRVHVATFDSTQGEKFNKNNCEEAQQLFQATLRLDATVKFWCEKGRFKK